MATKTTTPVTTPAGADPFAGAPGDPNTAPAASASTATDPVAGASTATGMPTFTGSGTSKTAFGVPISQDQTIVNPGRPTIGPVGHDREDTTLGTQSTTQPNYVDGDQWAPASDPNPDNIRSLQAQLIAAGLVQASKVHLGVWDKYSADAYAKVLAQANLTGVNAQTAMGEYVASSSHALPAKINGDDLTAMSQSVAQNMLGRNLNPAELTKFNAAFQAAYLSAEQSPTGAPTTAAGLQQMGGDILTKENPRAVAANSLHQVSQRALAVLSSPAVSLPSVQ